MAREILRLKAAGVLAPSTLGNQGTGGKNQSLSTENGLSPKYIFGTDERYQVSDTSVYPYRATARWTISGCAAFFVGPRTIVTVAHCLYNRASGTWPNNGLIVPGKNGAYEPWGQWTVSSFYIPSAFVTTTNADSWNWDFGVADLTIAPGYTGSPGWFGLDEYNGTYNTYSMDGYPQDKPGQTQQWHKYPNGTGTIIGSTGTRWEHQLDAIPGDSGACMYHWTNLGGPNCSGVQSSEVTNGSGTPIWNEVRKYDNYMWTFIRDYSSAW